MDVCCTWEINSSQYKKTIENLAIILRKNSLLPFFGAGISNDPPSNLPLGGTLRNVLISNLLNITKKYLFQNREKECRNDEFHGARTILNNVMLEKIFGGIYDVFGDEALIFWDVLDTNDININHKIITMFVERGFFTNIVTLNFDVLIEKALTDRGISYKTVCPVDGYTFPENIKHYKVKIIKPHGSLPPIKNITLKFDHIIATIQKIGNTPSVQNTDEIINAIKEKNMNNILFAGYGDNDIDIFPIFIKHSSMLKHIIWFKYVDNAEMKNWTSKKWKKGLPSRLQRWLNDADNRVTVVCGKLADFFNHLLSQLDCDPILETMNCTSGPMINVNFLINNPYKTALALAHLLENSGERQLSLNIFSILREKQLLLANPSLNAYMLSRFAWGCHARGDLTSAFSYRKEAKKILLNNKSIADLNIELGYEYWSFVKKPNLKTVNFVYKIPWFLFHGWSYFRKAKRYYKNYANNSWVISFYYGDLLHYFARITMLISGRIDMLTKLFLMRANIYYNKALRERKINCSMADFYKMRYVETQILLNKVVDLDGLINDVIDATYTYEIINDDIQIAYSQVIHALLCYYKGDRVGVVDHINKATKQYELPSSICTKKSEKSHKQLSNKTTPHLSGLMEVVCYERFFRIKSFSESIKYILKLIRQHKLNNLL